MSELIIEQRSEAWFELRKGKITSSEIHKIMGERGLSETAKSYLLEKVVEFYDGYSEPAVGKALEWGTELEPIAIEHYQGLKQVQVDKASFVPYNDNYGGSPDGLIGKEGVIEVKCPYKSANHFKHGLIKDAVSFKKIAPNYYWQCMSNMICTGTKWCDFVSYDPRVKEGFEMFIFRLELDEQEAENVKERLKVAVEYMETLKKDIEASKPA